MSESSFKFDAGILICGNVREILESEQFYGRKIRFREGRGWISRVFDVAGDEADVIAVKGRIEHYAKCMGD